MKIGSTTASTGHCMVLWGPPLGNGPLFENGCHTLTYVIHIIYKVLLLKGAHRFEILVKDVTVTVSIREGVLFFVLG